MRSTRCQYNPARSTGVKYDGPNSPRLARTSISDSRSKPAAKKVEEPKAGKSEKKAPPKKKQQPKPKPTSGGTGKRAARKGKKK